MFVQRLFGLTFSLSFFFSVNCREEQALAILNFDRKRTDITQSIFWFLVLVRDRRQFSLLILSKFTVIISPWNQEATYVFLILSRGLKGILIAWFRFILEVKFGDNPSGRQNETQSQQKKHKNGALTHL